MNDPRERTTRPRRRWLFSGLAAFLALLHGACVLPAPKNEDPSFFNNAPRIIPFFPPPETGPVFMQPSCPDYTFTVLLQDTDPEDTVFYRVFLDYHRTTNRPGARDTQVFDVTGSAAQPLSVLFEVEPSEFPGADPFVPGDNPHLVEILVSDREFLREAAPQGRAVPEDALTDSFIWTVVLDEGAPCNL